MQIVWRVCLLGMFLFPTGLTYADETADLFAVISRAGANGAGSVEAREARDKLARRGSEILPQILAAMDTPNPVAANWARSLYEEVIASELARPQPNLPKDLLREIVRDSRKQGKLRRLVLELLDKSEPEFGRQLLPTLLDDPEFRNDAITLMLQQGDQELAAKRRDAAREAYRKAFVHSRQLAQASASAGKLKSVGGEANVVTHLGFIVDWLLLGPFDAPGTTGYRTVFPPELKLDLQGEFVGSSGKKLRWQPYHSASASGDLDLAKAIFQTDEAVAFAYAELNLESSRPVPEAQVRCGADDNCTVWVNGERVFGRDQWLNSSRPDRFTAPVKLRSGKNTLLVKICQGPHHVDPTIGNNWTLQLRICDPTGAGVGLQPLLPTQKVAEEKK